jgi:hypothetical protein
MKRGYLLYLSFTISATEMDLILFVITPYINNIVSPDVPSITTFPATELSSQIKIAQISVSMVLASDGPVRNS